MEQQKQRVIKLRELDLNNIHPHTGAEDETGSKIVIIGKPGSGKSFLLRDLIYTKRHIFPVAEVVSGTESSNKFFKAMFPDITIHDQLSIDLVKGFIRRQKIAKELFPRWAWAYLIMDDCMDDPAIFRNSVFLSMMKNGRHWKLLYLLCMQWAIDILPALRICIDGVFIFREPNPRYRKILFENYAGIFGDYKLFCKVMDTITDDNTAIYVDNRSQSNKLEDCVFWYKAREVGEFKVGCEDYWMFHEQRYDTNYKEIF